MMFTISSQPLQITKLAKGFSNAKAGAFVSFEGRVRNENDGKKVIRLEYEIFNQLALKEGNKILKEARKKFNALKVKCVHRSGKLKIGDFAVWVGVVAPHRDEAFKACHFIIDEIKLRVPIWKKEFYSNENPEWVAGNGKIRDREVELYSHQIALPQIGREGQKKLKNARVLVIGAGGLGSPALLYLAAAGIGTIGICEHDKLETSNLHRQILFSFGDVGQSKAELAEKRLKELNPFVRFKIHSEPLDLKNVLRLVNQYDLLIDCTDNFLAKYILNDAAVLNKIPLICASVYQFEGQVKFYKPEPHASCLRCLWPKIPEINCDGICATAGVLGVTPALFGIIEAAEAIKFFVGLPTLSSDELLTVDLMSCYMKTIKQPKESSCPLCGAMPTIKTIDAKNFQPAENVDLNLNVLPKKDFKEFTLIDVREPKERAQKPIEAVKCLKIPTSQFLKHQSDFDKNKKYLLFCATGSRSNRLTRELRQQGIENSFSIQNGAEALNKYLSKN